MTAAFRRPPPMSALETEVTEGVAVAAFDDRAEKDLGLRLLRALDAEAWRAVFEDHYRFIRLYSYRRTGSREEADDIAASVFVEAVKAIGTFRCGTQPFVAWLLGIARHETADALGRRKRQARISLDMLSPAHPPSVPDPTAEWDRHLDVERALDRLRPSYRLVLLHRFIDGLTVREVSLVLGKSEGSVRVTQTRALRALRTQFDAGDAPARTLAPLHSLMTLRRAQ